MLKVSDEDIQKMNELINDGIALREVANICGVSTTTVRTYTGYKANTNVKPKYTHEDEKKIIELREQGKSVNSIASIVEVSEYLVKKIIKENNLEKGTANSDKANNLKYKLIACGLSPKDLKVIKSRHIKGITAIYWKGVKINVMNGATKQELLNEKGTYTLNLILQAEKEINE